MAQMKFGQCVIKDPRPRNPTPEYPGYFTVDVPPPCLSNGEEAPRRRDVARPQWHKGGVPTQMSCAAMDNLEGIASDYTGAHDLVYTEQGPIKLMTGPTRVGYMPSVIALEALPYAGTRLTGISDRYYDR